MDSNNTFFETGDPCGYTIGDEDGILKEIRSRKFTDRITPTLAG